MAELNLLPRKVFEITLDNKEVIKGQYSLWSVKRFTDRKKIPLSKLESLLDQDEITMDDVCQLILCAVEYSVRLDKKPFNYTDLDACQWLEQLGGLASQNFIDLMNHSKTEEPATADEGEKKSP